jgi:hypothetical protein
MKALLTIISTVLIFSIAIISNIDVSEASRFVDTRENYVGFKTYTGNRLHTFSDTDVDFCITTTNSTYQQIAISALNDWHGNITKATDNAVLWNIHPHVLPYDESICDGYINYDKSPDLDWYALFAVVGVSNPYQSIANVTIYTDFYQDTLRKITEKEWKEMTIEKFRNIVHNGTHPTWDATSMERVTLHELGHAFSLNHPCQFDSCNIYTQKGIMGYNMSETRILEEEAKNIVLAYPNGFIKNTEVLYSKIVDVSETPRTYYVGQSVSFQIEFPMLSNDLKYSGFTILMYPNNVSPMPNELAPMRFTMLDHVSNSVGLNNEYIKDFHAFPVFWIGATEEDQLGKYIITSSFVGIKEMNEIKMRIILYDQTGQEKQLDMDTPFVIKDAAFSYILQDNKFDDRNHVFSLHVDSPNNAIEKEYYVKLKAEKQYYEDLKECLTKKNMAYCNANVISLESRQLN